MTVKVGLTQRMEWLAERGEMRQILDVAWNQRLLRAGALPVALPMDGADPESLVERYGVDVLLLTGGNQARDPFVDSAYAARNRMERTLLAVAREAGTPVLGVCHGMQVMNAFCGGGLGAAPGHVRTAHVLDSTSATLRGVKVNSFHDVVIPHAQLAGDLLLLARAEDGTVEAVVHRSLPWLAVMWHPERAMPDGHDGIALVARFLAAPAKLCNELRGEAR
jgi:putative glutamine amidotransferase